MSSSLQLDFSFCFSRFSPLALSFAGRGGLVARPLSAAARARVWLTLAVVSRVLAEPELRPGLGPRLSFALLLFAVAPFVLSLSSPLLL